MATFTFGARWKEELVCEGPGGRFVLELTMGGALTAYLPSQAAWPEKAPAWALDLWPVLKAELDDWCAANGAKFFIDDSAQVWPE